MAVDPNIKKKANDIRTKIKGKEVRESLASGLEAISSSVGANEMRQGAVESRQDEVESQWQTVVDETTGKDIVSAPEIITARGTYNNLSERLLSTDQQLEKTVTKPEFNLFKHHLKRNTVISEEIPDDSLDWRVWYQVFPLGILFDLGDQNEHETGGWKVGIVEGNGVAEIRDDHMFLSATEVEGSKRSFETIKKIDFTNLNTLYIDFEIEMSSLQWFRFGVHRNPQAFSSGEFEALISRQISEGRSTVELDVSGITSELYVSVRASVNEVGNSSIAKIYRIWGE